MADTPRPFVIPVRNRWTLWILPTLALLYFVAVIVLASLGLEVEGVSNDVLVLGGVALFALVVLVEIPFLLRRRAPREEEPEAEAAEALDPYAPPPAYAPAPPRVDDETLVTDETQQGYRVLEYSSPAKSRQRGAVFAKTYVPVTKEHVLRVETLAAEPHEV